MTTWISGTILLLVAVCLLAGAPAFAVIWGIDHRTEHQDVRDTLSRAADVAIFFLARDRP